MKKVGSPCFMWFSIFTLQQNQNKCMHAFCYFGRNLVLLLLNQAFLYKIKQLKTWSFISSELFKIYKQIILSLKKKKIIIANNF